MLSDTPIPTFPRQGGGGGAHRCPELSPIQANPHFNDFAPLASRRRERMAKELEREKDYAVTLSRAALAKVAERIDSMDFKGLEARQVPVALKRLFELEFKALGMEDKVALSHEGKVEVEAAADTAWLMDYLRQLREGSEDEGQPEG